MEIVWPVITQRYFTEVLKEYCYLLMSAESLSTSLREDERSNWNVLWKNCFAVFKVKVTANIQNMIEWLSKQYLWNYLTFRSQAWYGDASSWVRVSCKRIVLLLSGQCHSKGSYNQNMIIFAVSSSFDSLAAKLHSMVHHHKLVTVMIQNVIECLLVLHFLYYWYVCNQSRCVDVHY